MNNLTEKKRTFLEERVLPILNYIGLIGAIILSIAYIVVVIVLIKGFKVEDIMNITIFAIVNAAVGFSIIQFLKVQGESFARMLPENQEIIKKYYNTKTKDKKPHSMVYFWVTSVVKDIIVKCATIGASCVGVIYIVVVGSNDYNMLLLAFVNLLLFICFGFLSLVKAYNFFNENHVPFMKERLGIMEDVQPKTDENGVKSA